jgi:hypothetical protein
MDSFFVLLIIASVTGGGFLAWTYTKPGKSGSKTYNDTWQEL